MWRDRGRRGGTTLDDSRHPDDGGHEEDPQHPDDVKVEELSDSRLRITVGRIVEDVTVERLYHTNRSFGPFRSLDSLIAFLRKKSEEAE
jgi:hypothetical protein